jgi:hypothetical protein
MESERRQHVITEEALTTMENKNPDQKLEDLILRKLYEHAGHEAVLVPSMFQPPVMLSNIFRIGGILKKKGYTTAPDRRLGGWHMRLLEPGILASEKKA